MRVDQGRWLDGFCCRIGYASPLKVELWGIKRGLKLAKDRGWKKVIIETDCETALELIETGEIDNHPEKIIIEDCRMLERKWKLISSTPFVKIIGVLTCYPRWELTKENKIWQSLCHRMKLSS